MGIFKWTESERERVEDDMEIALGVCDQVSVLNWGRLIAEGSPEQISQNQMVHDIYLGRKPRDDA